MTRVCSICGVEKNMMAFPKNGKDKHSETMYRADCKECYNIIRSVKPAKVKKFINNTKHRTGEIATLTVKDWRDAMIHFRGRCAYCAVRQQRGKLHRLTKDHVVPVHSGGLTTRTNTIPACTHCNSSKSDHPLSEWYPKQVTYTVARMEAIYSWVNQVLT